MRVKNMISLVNNLKKSFNVVETSEYFGWINKKAGEIDLDSIVQESKRNSPRFGKPFGKFFIKNLGTQEYSSFPAERFTNAAFMYPLAFPETMPMPLGLIYSGNWGDLVVGNSEGFYITPHIEGKALNIILKEIPEDYRKSLFGIIALNIINLRDRGAYLMDFAPRDIIIKTSTPLKKSISSPVFVDTENVKLYPKNPKIAIKEQYDRFLEEYKDVVNREELNIVNRLLNRKRTYPLWQEQ